MSVKLSFQELFAPTDVFADGKLCILRTSDTTQLQAACPLPSNLTASISVVWGPANYTATSFLSVPSSSVSTVPFNKSIAWGSTITVLLVPAIAANVTSINISSAGISASCDAVRVINASVVSCTLSTVSEAWFDRAFDLLLTYTDGTVGTVLAANLNLTVIRHTIANISPVVLPNAGGNVVIATLPFALPNNTVCRVSAVRAWFGMAASSSCQLINFAVVSCVSPPGTSQLVRLTIQVCNTYNVTSDGLAPTADLQPVKLGTAVYLSYDPSPYFEKQWNYTTPQALQRTTSNITIVGTSLQTLMPMITGVSLAGGVCGRVAALDNATLMCYDWPYDANAGSPSDNAADVSLTIRLLFRGSSVALRPELQALHAPQVFSVFPPATVPGARIAVFGTFFRAANDVPANVTVGGLACSDVSSSKPESLLECTVPRAISASTSGFPSVVVVVTTPAGPSSDDVRLTIQPEASASFISSGPLRAIGSSDLQLLPVAPAPVLKVTGELPIRCTLGMSAWVCPVVTFQYGLPYIAGSGQVDLVGSITTILASSGVDSISFSSLGLHARAGCVVNVSARCQDANQRTCSSDSMLPIQTATLSMKWNETIDARHVLPHELVPVPDAIVDWPADCVSNETEDQRAQHLSCVAVLISNTSIVPVDAPLSMFAGLATMVSGIPSYVNTTSIAISFPSLTSIGCILGEMYAVFTECVWLPTSERVRLPPVPVTIASLHLGVYAPVSAAGSYSTLAYSNQSVIVTLDASLSGHRIPLDPMACHWVVVDVTDPASKFVQYPLQLAHGGGYNMTSVFDIHAMPTSEVQACVECTVYSQAIKSQPIRFVMQDMRIAVMSELPSEFVPSDKNARSLDPILLTVGVRADNSITLLSHVQCSLSVVDSMEYASVTLLPPAGMDTSVFSGVAGDDGGVITFPPLHISAPLLLPRVQLLVSCVRPGGDGPEPMSLSLPAATIRMALCSVPASMSISQVKLPSFRVAIASNCSGGPAHLNLPPVICGISLASDAEAASMAGAALVTSSTNMSVFLLGTMAVVQHTGMATFDAFSITARPAFTYALSLSCAIGSLSIPPRYTFAVTLDGCPAGSEQADFMCQQCPSTGFFSLGTNSSSSGSGSGSGSAAELSASKCTACPRAGAVCANGLLSLLPHYFRPPSQAQQPLGPDTELHPCYNSEACTLNIDTFAYGCAAGYSGALCGVCGEDYSKYTDTCLPCWAPGASIAFVTVVLVIVLLLLARVALRKVTPRSDASVVLRITMSYIQAVGSLRVFKAGGTKAYHDVMGWTEAVSSSPLSGGAFHCVMPLSFLQQYISTILVPAIAAVAVITIFMTVNVWQACSCRRRVAFDSRAFHTHVTAWWRSKRHVSTLLFVLFIAYMPITSASLRVLDCVDEAVDGIIYLRSDLSVECWTGDHAVAAILAYTVLCVIGVGFPAGLAFLLSRATPQQLASSAFHGTWGFLFDGYRLPTRDVTSKRLSFIHIGMGSNGRLSDLFSAAPALLPSAPDTAAATPPATQHGAPSKARKDEDPSSSSLVWWESMVLLRKAGIVLLAVLVTNPYMQCVGATLWLGGHFVLQLHFKPFVEPRFNRLEALGLASATATVTLCTALLQYNTGVEQHAVKAMTGIEWVVTVLLAVINLSTMAVLTGTWLQLQCRRAVSKLAAIRSSVTAAPDSVERVEKEPIPSTNNPLLLAPRRVIMQQSDVVAKVAAASLPTASMANTRADARRSAATFSPLKRTV